MEVKLKLKKFIESHILSVEDSFELGDGDNIFKQGFLDSMFALQLVNFIEQEFGIEITDEDLDIQNFNTIERILLFISKKKKVKHV